MIEIVKNKLSLIFCFIELPVVNCDWLISCSKTKQRLPMRPFLIGASVVPAGETADEDKHQDTDAGPISSTANTRDGNEAKIPTDISPIRPIEQAEPAVDRLKRQRPGDFVSPTTPVLKHRRLSELGGGFGSRNISPMLTQSPQIPFIDTLKGLLDFRSEENLCLYLFVLQIWLAIYRLPNANTFSLSNATGKTKHQKLDVALKQSALLT